MHTVEPSEVEPAQTDAPGFLSAWAGLLARSLSERGLGDEVAPEESEDDDG